MIEAEDKTFGALAAAEAKVERQAQDIQYFKIALADVCTERDDWRAKANRLKLANELLLREVAHLKAQLQAGGSAADLATMRAAGVTCVEKAMLFAEVLQ